MVLIVILLLFVGIFAITQETQETVGTNNFVVDYLQSDTMHDDELFEEMEMAFVWMPPGPPRWFRSNAGGMTLEEMPSRLAALRHNHALVIDYIPPDELDPRLLPFYQNDYSIEIHILYAQGEESRKQWLFRDDSGLVRLNAVFRPPPAEIDEEEIIEVIIELDDDAQDDDITNIIAGEFPDVDTLSLAGLDDDDFFEDLLDDLVPDEEAPVIAVNNEMGASLGFMEMYNENGKIVQDYSFFEDDGEILTVYFYNDNFLIKTETSMRPSGADTPEHRMMYTDTYRYNRSYSLRSVERLYHESSDAQPVRFTFQGRILDAVADTEFLTEKLSLSSDFLGSHSVEEGFRMIYHTDARGRILSQSMLDANNDEVWIIENIWAGDRIVATIKTEGADERRTEYEYDSDGNRVMQRDINNGVLERLVHGNAEKEVEELYLNGVVVLRAYWEDGKKIREERVRR